MPTTTSARRSQVANENVIKRIGARMDVAMMLTFDCYANGGKTIDCESLGGDGKIVEGQSIPQQTFRFQP